MAKSSFPQYLKIAGIGALTGVRSMAGPALVIPRLTETVRRPFYLRVFPRFVGFARPSKASWPANLLQTMAAAEMIADKLPIAPDRNAPAPLMFRTLVGAVTGALTARLLGRSGGANLWLGALTGGVAAAASTYGIHRLRQLLEDRTGLPGFIAGLIEDAAVLQLGKRILAPAG